MTNNVVKFPRSGQSAATPKPASDRSHLARTPFFQHGEVGSQTWDRMAIFTAVSDARERGVPLEDIFDDLSKLIKMVGDAIDETVRRGGGGACGGSTTKGGEDR